MQELREDLKALIVEALGLEDVTAEEIGDDELLFGDGLGLDSIDALELAISIHKRYGVRIAADDERNQEIFRSVSTLAAHVAEQRGGEEGS